MSVAWCDTCHRMIGISCACNMSLAEKIRGLQLHPNATPSKEKRNYFDRQALHQTFGEDARDKVMEQTQGKGLNGNVSLAELFD